MFMSRLNITVINITYEVTLHLVNSVHRIFEGNFTLDLSSSDDNENFQVSTMHFSGYRLFYSSNTSVNQ